MADNSKEDFKIAELVQVKNLPNAPAMIVETINLDGGNRNWDRIGCLWFDNLGNVHTNTFFRGTIEKLLGTGNYS